MSTLSDLRQRPHISVSQLKTFITCPRRYGDAGVMRRSAGRRRQRKALSWLDDT